jgi:hypothetical protein
MAGCFILRFRQQTPGCPDAKVLLAWAVSGPCSRGVYLFTILTFWITTKGLCVRHD